MHVYPGRAVLPVLLLFVTILPVFHPPADTREAACDRSTGAISACAMIPRRAEWLTVTWLTQQDYYHP
jgi:hypothetical protein